MSWQPQAHTCTHKVRTHGCCWSNGATCWCCQANFPDSLVCSCTSVWKKRWTKQLTVQNVLFYLRFVSQRRSTQALRSRTTSGPTPERQTSLPAGCLCLTELGYVLEEVEPCSQFSLGGSGHGLVCDLNVTVPIFLFLCAQGVRSFLLLPMPDSALITNLNTHFNYCFAVFWLRQINTYLLTFFSFIPTFCFNSKVWSLKSSRCL